MLYSYCVHYDFFRTISFALHFGVVNLWTRKDESKKNKPLKMREAHLNSLKSKGSKSVLKFTVVQEAKTQ